jgi:hypothetical protein
MDGEAGAKALNAQRASSDVDMSDPAIGDAWSTAQTTSALAYVALGYAAGSKKKCAFERSNSGRAHVHATALAVAQIAAVIRRSAGWRSSRAATMGSRG